MIKCIAAIILFFTWISAFAQQDITYAHYMFSPVSVNPASAGLEDGLSTAAFHKRQTFETGRILVGNLFQVSSPLRYNQMGIGGSFSSVQSRIASVRSLIIHYNYRINAFGGIVSFGMYGGIRSYSVDFNSLNVRHNYDVIISPEGTGIIPDLGAGLHFNKSNYYLGLAVHHLNESAMRLGTNTASNASLSRHYYALSAYNIQLNENIVFKPSVLLKWVPQSSFQADLTGHLFLKDSYWLGVLFRTSNELSIQGGLDVSHFMKKSRHSFRISYAYEVPFKPLNIISTATNEIALLWRFVPRPVVGKLKKMKVTKYPIIY